MARSAPAAYDDTESTSSSAIRIGIFLTFYQLSAQIPEFTHSARFAPFKEPVWRGARSLSVDIQLGAAIRIKCHKKRPLSGH